MQLRQVVTGHDANGRAVMARQACKWDALPGLGELAFLWSADERWWEPKWEPISTDGRHRQATSSKQYGRLTPHRAASGYLGRLGRADLGAGGRGFESRHPD